MNKVNYILGLAKSGEFGTPDCPNRGSSAKCHFWNAYNGIKTANPKGITYAYHLAGIEYRKIIEPTAKGAE